MYEIKKEKKYNSNQTLNENEEKNGLYNSFNALIEKEREIIKNIRKRPKTFENKLNYNNDNYQIGGYLIKNNLGEGTFGKVKLGIYIKTGEKVAIKIIDKRKLIEKNDQIHLKREIDLLQKLNHINIISVYEIFENIDNYYIVMEFCSKGELFNYIVSKQRLNENEASYFFYQLINGLEYIHSIGISHRDIKPENLLLTNNYILKIIDFGLSNYYRENISNYLQTPCGSPCYSSPEMVSGHSYDGFKVDIWSSGIVLFAMLCGYLPFDDKNDDKIIFKKIVECEVKYPFFLSDISKDIITKLLIKDPNKRINIKQIKSHPFYLKGKKKYESNLGIINKSKILTNFTERSFFQKSISKKENEKNDNIKKNKENIKNKIEELQKVNYSIDDNDNENSQKDFCYIPIETDIQEYANNEKFKDKIIDYKINLNTDNGMRFNKNKDKTNMEKRIKNNSNLKEKKEGNKSKEKSINKIFRKNILSILFNQKKINKYKNIKLNINNEKKHSVNLTNIISSFKNNQKINKKDNKKNLSNNMYYISSSENCTEKAHSKAKEKVSKLTKNFDINIINIEYLNTDVNEACNEKSYIKKSQNLKNYIIKPKSNNKEECKNNKPRKNCLIIESKYNNLEFKSKKNLNKNNNYYIFKDDSLNKDNFTKSLNNNNINLNIENKSKKENNSNHKVCNIIKNYKSMNQINQKKINTLKDYNLPFHEFEQNSNNNLNNFSQLSKKFIYNKNVINKNFINENKVINKIGNDRSKKKYRINSTLSNLNDYLSSNDLNVFNQKSKNKRKNKASYHKNSKEINIKKLKDSISKKNKLIALTKKKSFFTIRDTVINFDTGNGKIIILPTLNKSKDIKKEKDNKKSKSLQGLQKSSTNTKIQTNYLIKRMKNEKISSLLINYKLNDISNKTCNTNNNTNNNISKELSFNNKDNILYNYCNYKEKKESKSLLFNNINRGDEQKNSGYFSLQSNYSQNSQEKNYTKFNRVKIEEYYRNNINLNYGNNHKINKINLINYKNKKNHCITNLYMNSNLKIDITGNFRHHKQKLSNVIKNNYTFSKNENYNKNNSNSSNNINCLNDKNIYRHKHSNNIYSYKTTHKKMLNLTHRTENGIQKVLNNIMI